MPELPEVEVIRRFLNLNIVKEQIGFVDVLYEKSIECAGSFGVSTLYDQTVNFVNRKGKYLHLGLDNNDLVIHLRMTGQLYFEPDTIPKDHIRWVFNFKSGKKLYFRDVRKFGRLIIYPKGELEFCKNADIGFEPWEMPLDTWGEKLKTERAIKIVLLDQHVIAGIGNIYADEALYLSGIHPERKASSLDHTEAKDLLKAIRIVLDQGIRYGGTTFRDYLGGDGKKGAMQDHLYVYQKTGSNCLRCSRPISRIKVGGRSSHFCSNCQS
ncbi:MAG: DNA-formamidopyrimidine glycosylase [Firmicutes bacterium]|nr:DNA-formamidopyrimidine glycosylase [Bacillota bacterium]